MRALVKIGLLFDIESILSALKIIWIFHLAPANQKTNAWQSKLYHGKRGLCPQHFRNFVTGLKELKIVEDFMKTCT